MDLATFSKPIKGIIFDKDGTLFDLKKTWTSWIHTILNQLSHGNADWAAQVGRDLGYDFYRQQFIELGKFDVWTPEELVKMLNEHFSQYSYEELADILHNSAINTPQVLIPNLAQELHQLKGDGYVLGIATNDSEDIARHQLKKYKLIDYFAFIAGSNSGYGAKPDPLMLLAFCDQLEIDANETVMVGDSVFDIQAGHQAGMHTVAVLTGLTARKDLRSSAGKVLNDVQELHGYLTAIRSAQYSRNSHNQSDEN